VSATFGQVQAATDVSPASPALWQAAPHGRSAPTHIVPSSNGEPARRGLPPSLSDTAADAQFSPAFYHELDISLDRKEKTYWCFLRPEGVPSFTHGILRDLSDMQRSIKRMFAESAAELDPPVRHFVVASRLAGIFNMGGDLGFFADRIRAGDRAALANYARACIEVVYNNATALHLPIVTIALVQGDALGGGFEAALSCHVIVAEKSAKMGMPEILFNLFPGMGAYSLLARKLDPARAERMIFSGRIYSAAELHDMGVVDVLAEDGEGEDVVRQYIARNARRHGVQRSLCEVRRRINPLTFEELQDVTEIWVDTAMRLEELDLRKMEHLMAAQRRRLAARTNGAAEAIAR
jgi:DSF synthase